MVFILYDWKLFSVSHAIHWSGCEKVFCVGSSVSGEQ
jgi:hypothetical protein